MLADHLPTALRYLRESRGLSQDAAAAQIRERTGTRVAGPRISQWETGKESPSSTSLCAFLDGLEADFRELQRLVDLVAEGIPPSAQEAIEQYERRMGSDPDFRARLESLERQMEELQTERKGGG